ncbi:MAG TPA: BadF/BadG/BcrA/BcrD ATPase family protein [Gaiellaceae bacterium]|nr:BadF/BadG/BcrA/BcrD ATPase family protein [Gaiellaceae bacterium]
MGVILGVDGGNSKTALLTATTDGELLAYVLGAGTNSHAIGAEGVAEVIGALAAQAGFEQPADHGVFFLCGADVPADIEALTDAVRSRGWARKLVVDNDTFALLRVGTDAPDAVAVICGAGINVVGRGGDGRIVRYPSLGWETGDWGGAEMLGREVLRLGARGEDGRGDPTVLSEIVRTHFGAAKVEDVGADVHYKRMPMSRLGELAPAVIAAAEGGDGVAWSLVDLLATEIVLMTMRTLKDLGVRDADVVLGGGMLQSGDGLLYQLVTERLPLGARPVPARDEPVLGAALAALDAAGATDAAKARLREELRAR